jgi:hypothetical protein
MDRADPEVKRPKWELAVLFLVDGAGFVSLFLEHDCVTHARITP